MAIQFDARTNGTIGTGNVTWNHTGTANAKGVIVFVVQNTSTTDAVTSVTYGGTTMSRARTYVTQSAGGEASAVFCYVLLSSVPTGTQEVVVTVSSAVNRATTCITVKAGGGGTIEQVNTATISTDAANPSTTLTLGGTTSLVAIAFQSGANAITGITPFSGWATTSTGLDPGGYEYDLGSQTTGCYIYDTIGSTDVTVGWTQSTADACAIAIALTETGGVNAYNETVSAAQNTVTVGTNGFSVAEDYQTNVPEVSLVGSPVTASGTPTSGLATASVSWQTNDVIVALCGTNNSGGTQTVTATGLTFGAAKVSRANTSGGTAYIYAAVAGSDSSSTVTWTTEYGSFGAITVVVLRGADTTALTTTNSAANANSTAMSESCTIPANRGYVLAAALGSGTANGGSATTSATTEIADVPNAGTSDSWWAGRNTTVTLGTPTVACTWASNQDWGYALLGIGAAAAAQGGFNETIAGSHQTVTVGTDGFSVALSNQLAAQADGNQCSVTIGTSGFDVDGTVSSPASEYNESLDGSYQTITVGADGFVVAPSRKSGTALDGDQSTATPGDNASAVRLSAVAWPEESVNATDSVAPARRTDLSFPEESVNPTESVSEDRKTDLTLPQESVNTTDSADAARKTDLTTGGDQSTVTATESISEDRLTEVTVTGDQITVTTDDSASAARRTDLAVSEAQVTATDDAEGTVAEGGSAYNEGIDGVHQTVTATEQTGAARRTDALVDGFHNTTTATEQATATRQTNVTMGGDQSTATPTDQVSEDRNTNVTMAGAESTVTATDQYAEDRRTDASVTGDQTTVTTTDQTSAARRTNVTLPEESTTPSDSVAMLRKQSAEISESVTPSEIVDGLVNQDGRIWNEWWGETTTTDFSIDALVIRTGVLTESSNVQSTSEGSLSIPVTVAGAQTTATASESVTAQKLLPGTLTETLPQPSDSHAATRRSAAALSESTQPTDTADVLGKFLNSLSETVTPSEIVDGLVNQSGQIWNEGWSETVTATDHVEGSDIGVYEGYFSESVTSTEQVAVTRKTGQDLTETVTATDTCAATIERNVDVSESVTPDTTVAAAGLIDAGVTEEVNTQDQQDYVHLLGVDLEESVTASDSTDLLGNFVSDLTETTQPGDEVDTDAVTEVFNEELIETVRPEVWQDTPYIPPGTVHTGVFYEYVTATDALGYTHQRPVEPPVVVVPSPDVTYRVTMLDSESHSATVSDLTTHRVIVITEE